MAGTPSDAAAPGERFCPACAQSVSAFLPGPAGRTEAKCPRCFAFERHRFLAHVLERMAPLVSSARAVLEVSPQRQLRRMLVQRLNANYVGVDLELVRRVDALADVTRLPFRAGAFDVIICFHVLEHVPDDARAMRELSRVLADGGVALIQSPYRPRRPTDEDPSAPPDERVRRFGQADHVRWYGADFEERLRANGLVPTPVTPARFMNRRSMQRMGVPRDQRIWLCRRAPGANRSIDASALERVIQELYEEREARIAAEAAAGLWQRRAEQYTGEAEHWRGEYERVRNHPVVRALLPLRRAVQRGGRGEGPPA